MAKRSKKKSDGGDGPAFPEEIYVTSDYDVDGDDFYYTHPEIDSIEDGRYVGVYKLVAVKIRKSRLE